MRSLGTARRRGVLALGLAVILAVPALAWTHQAADALAKLERGRWVVRSATNTRLERSICLGDSALLFQVEHGGTDCAREWVAAGEGGASVRYTCPGHGFGHTSVRIETSKVAVIDTRGFVDGRPFSYRATARKVSDC